MTEPTLVERSPTVEEYARLIASVGWKERDPEAVGSALGRSCFSVCAEVEGRAVGMGRVTGDGGLHYYITDVVVDPGHQRLGIGTAIVRALGAWLETLSHPNTFVGVFATGGTRRFYERLGFKAQGAEGPAMFRWLNPRPPS